MESLLRALCHSELCLLRYLSSAILYSALVALNSIRNSLVSLNSLFSLPSSSLRRTFRRLLRFRAHVSINQMRIERANWRFCYIKRNERRPIRAWKAKQEREWTRVQIDWTIERELMVAIRSISTYMASRRNIARCICESPQCVSSVAEIAGEWRRRSWLATGARLASTKPQPLNLLAKRPRDELPGK